VTEDGAAGTTLIKVVTGTAVLNTGYFRMNNKTTFTAPHIQVMKTACNVTTYPLAHCSKGATICANTKASTAGVKPMCAPPANAHTVWTFLSAPVQDPLATLTDPTPAALGLKTYTTCQPQAGRLKPGEYDCGGTPLTLSGGGTVTLAHGIYIFDTGVKVNGGTTLNGTTILIYLPCHTADAWVPTGTLATSCTESFEISMGQVNVTPLGTPPYADLWFWQNSVDTTGQFTAHGQGALNVSTGVLYAPGAEVDLTGLGRNKTVGAVVASTFRVANSHVTVTGFQT
jgi:hypothetical protein